MCTAADIFLNLALVSAQLHPQLPLPGAMGLAPTSSDRHSPPLEDAPLIMSSIHKVLQSVLQECLSFSCSVAVEEEREKLLEHEWCVYIILVFTCVYCVCALTWGVCMALYVCSAAVYN